jgi:hypothetical protein
MNCAVSSTGVSRHLRSLNVIAATAVKLGWDQLGDSRKRTLHGRCARRIATLARALHRVVWLVQGASVHSLIPTQLSLEPKEYLAKAPLCTATLMHHTCVQQHPTRNPTPLTHPPPLPHKSPMHALSARQLLTRTFCAVVTWQEPCQSALLGSPRSSIARSSASTALPKRTIMTLHSFNHNHHHHLRRNYRYTHP